MGTSRFEVIAEQIGKLTAEKNEAYGDSASRSGAALEIFYPRGVSPAQYGDMLLVVRVLDKISRIATRKRALGESPWRDIAGYGLLGTALDEAAE